MALPALDINTIIQLDAKALDNYFMEFARSIPDAPKGGPRYAIRVGSKTLFDNDTYYLRKKFHIQVKVFKMNAARRRRRI